jgi:hypothetical protein
MDYSTGKIAFILVVATVLACVASWTVAARYRFAMRRLMSLPTTGPRGAASEPAGAAPLPAARRATLADNRRASIRLSLLLFGLSCLLALSGASLWLRLAFPDEPYAWKRALVLALLQLWPVIPALALLWRWSTRRALGALLLWGALCFGVMLWRSIEPRPLELVLGLVVEIGPGLLIVTLLCSGNATRAVAPWLLPPIIGLVWASILGTDVLALLVERRSPWLMALPAWLGAHLVMLAFVLVPWLLAWWPLKRLSRALARAYTRKQLCELLVLFTAVWLISLLIQALSVASAAGLAGAAMLLPLLWIPAVVRLLPRRAEAGGRPPTLLVLRVFQHDAQIQELFDHVVERWRLSGNTVLIAGTDLADRTLDADDIFTFLDGALATRFIRSAAEVGPRLASFDLAADADGRFRVNECYCHDTTWQDALQALVQRSDVVLMDLRGFQAHNAGCLHELATLAAAERALRVIVLTDAQTDRAAADRAVAAAPQGRFVWVEATRVDARKRAEVLAQLFAT